MLNSLPPLPSALPPDRAITIEKLQQETTKLGFNNMQTSALIQGCTNHNSAIKKLYSKLSDIKLFMDETGLKASNVAYILTGAGDNIDVATEHLLTETDYAKISVGKYAPPDQYPTVTIQSYNKIRSRVQNKTFVATSDEFATTKLKIPEITIDHIIAFAPESAGVKSPIFKKVISQVNSSEAHIKNMQDIGFSTANIVHIFKGHGDKLAKNITSLMSTKSKVKELVEYYHQHDIPIDELAEKLNSKVIRKDRKVKRLYSEYLKLKHNGKTKQDDAAAAQPENPIQSAIENVLAIPGKYAEHQDLIKAGFTLEHVGLMIRPKDQSQITEKYISTALTQLLDNKDKLIEIKNSWLPAVDSIDYIVKFFANKGREIGQTIAEAYSKLKEPAPLVAPALPAPPAAPASPQQNGTLSSQEDSWLDTYIDELSSANRQPVTTDRSKIRRVETNHQQRLNGQISTTTNLGF